MLSYSDCHWYCRFYYRWLESRQQPARIRLALGRLQQSLLLKIQSIYRSQ